MNSRPQSPAPGFTLIRYLTCIAIIAIIAGLVTASKRSHRASGIFNGPVVSRAASAQKLNFDDEAYLREKRRTAAIIRTALK